MKSLGLGLLCVLLLEVLLVSAIPINKSEVTANGVATEVETGNNPDNYLDLSRSALKEFLKRAQTGANIAASVTSQALDSIQSLHDKKTELDKKFVRPIIVKAVNNALDGINGKVQSTIGVIKDKVESSRSKALKTLKGYEDNLEKEESDLPESFSGEVDFANYLFLPEDPIGKVKLSEKETLAIRKQAEKETDELFKNLENKWRTNMKLNFEVPKSPIVPEQSFLKESTREESDTKSSLYPERSRRRRNRNTFEDDD